MAQLKIRRVYYLIESRISWDSRMNMSHASEAVKELFFWKNNLLKHTERPMTRGNTPWLIVCSDASDTGLGAHTWHKNRMHISIKNFTLTESLMHSTWRELYAIQYSLQSLKSVLCNKAVLWKTDNYASHCIIKRGSSKENLQILAENIFDICKKQKIDLNVEWVPRNQIQYADKLSRYTDTDNWEITKSFFEYLNRLWGPFTVDRFANDENKKVGRFNSKYYCPETECVNAFNTSWENENNLLVPPIQTISKVLKHMQTCKASGTLVAPYWPSAAFWPFLTDSTGDFQKFIKNFRIFDNPNLCVTQGECKNNSFQTAIYINRIHRDSDGVVTGLRHAVTGHTKTLKINRQCFLHFRTLCKSFYATFGKRNFEAFSRRSTRIYLKFQGE